MNKFFSSEFLNEAYFKVRNDLTEQFKKRSVEEDKFTRDQLVEAVIQAIKAGDFTRLVMSTPKGSSDLQQTVIYQPYNGVEELRQQLADTREKLEKIKKILYPDENSD